MSKIQSTINNDFYNDLHDDWYDASNHPVALLRAENALRNPWIETCIAKHFAKNATILDIGCGAGLLTNFLAKKGHTVHGLDLSSSSIAVAKKNDTTNTVSYVEGNAYALPYEKEAFDVVIAMDILEHVEQPELLIEQASKVLRPNGLFFFHTFNRNFLSWLVIIKAVEWLVPNTPSNMHVYPLFIKPVELRSLCKLYKLYFKNIRGIEPQINSFFWKSLKQKSIHPNFSFKFSKNLLTGYCGYAQKS